MAADGSKPSDDDDDDALERAEFEREKRGVRAFIMRSSRHGGCILRRRARHEPDHLQRLSADLASGTSTPSSLDFSRRRAQGRQGSRRDVDVPRSGRCSLILEVPRPISSSGVRLWERSRVTTKIVASTALGHREELEIRVVDRSTIEIQWF